MGRGSEEVVNMRGVYQVSRRKSASQERKGTVRNNRNVLAPFCAFPRQRVVMRTVFATPDHQYINDEEEKWLFNEQFEWTWLQSG